MANREEKIAFIESVLEDCVPTMRSSKDVDRAIQYLKEIDEREPILPISVDGIGDKLALELSDYLYQKGMVSDIGALPKAIGALAKVINRLHSEGYIIIKK